MIRARIRADGRLAGGLQALLGAPVAACSGCGERNGGTGTARGVRGPGWRELAGTFSWPDVGTVADGRRQAGSGMARSRAGARVTFSCRGRRLGRCRVSRPAREKNRRRSVLVVTVRWPRPVRAVQRARLCAITGTASRAALAAKRPEGLWFSPAPCLRSRMAFSIPAWRRRPASSSPPVPRSLRPGR